MRGEYGMREGGGRAADARMPGPGVRAQIGADSNRIAGLWISLDTFFSF